MTSKLKLSSAPRCSLHLFRALPALSFKKNSAFRFHPARAARGIAGAAGCAGSLSVGIDQPRLAAFGRRPAEHDASFDAAGGGRIRAARLGRRGCDAPRLRRLGRRLGRGLRRLQQPELSCRGGKRRRRSEYRDRVSGAAAGHRCVAHDQRRRLRGRICYDRIDRRPATGPDRGDQLCRRPRLVEGRPGLRPESADRRLSRHGQTIACSRCFGSMPRTIISLGCSSPSNYSRPSPAPAAMSNSSAHRHLARTDTDCSRRPASRYGAATSTHFSKSRTWCCARRHCRHPRCRRWPRRASYRPAAANPFKTIWRARRTRPLPISRDGGFGWRSGQRTPQVARTGALQACQQYGKSCDVKFVDDASAP